jgi:hypothetical protein
VFGLAGTYNEYKFGFHILLYKPICPTFSEKLTLGNIACWSVELLAVVLVTAAEDALPLALGLVDADDFRLTAFCLGLPASVSDAATILSSVAVVPSASSSEIASFGADNNVM